MKLDPLQRYIPPPHTKKSALSGSRGGYAHAYGICAPLYCISLKKKLWEEDMNMPGV